MILLADNVSRHFDNRWAVCSINIRLARGDSLLIAGHNGAGKTTLLRLLTGALRATTGSVTLDGHDATKDPLVARRAIAMLAQRNGLYLNLTARENLSVVESLLGIPAPKDRVESLLARVGLSGHEDRAVRTFSSGMCKRLGLAQVLLQDAPIMLFDEPYGQLDSTGFEFVDTLFSSLLSAGKTLVVVTHLIDRAMPLIREAMLLDHGAMIWTGPSRDLPAHFRDQRS